MRKDRQGCADKLELELRVLLKVYKKRKAAVIRTGSFGL